MASPETLEQELISSVHEHTEVTGVTAAATARTRPGWFPVVPVLVAAAVVAWVVGVLPFGVVLGIVLLATIAVRRLQATWILARRGAAIAVVVANQGLTGRVTARAVDHEVPVPATIDFDRSLLGRTFVLGDYTYVVTRSGENAVRWVIGASAQ